QVFCLQKPLLVLPVEGAPLVFSTGLAHDFAITVQNANGTSTELPAVADAARGGLATDTHALQGNQFSPGSVGKLHGLWGYQPFTRPDFDLRAARTAKWTVAAADQSALIVDREDTLHLQSDSAACVEHLVMRDQQGKEIEGTWTLTKPDELEVRIPLQGASPGPVTFLITQSGMSKAAEVPLRAFSEAAHLEHLAINAGDRESVLTGTRLDEVSKLELNGISFLPGALSRANQTDELRLLAGDASASDLHPGQDVLASVTLKDDR